MKLYLDMHNDVIITEKMFADMAERYVKANNFDDIGYVPDVSEVMLNADDIVLIDQDDESETETLDEFGYKIIALNGKDLEECADCKLMNDVCTYETYGKELCI